MVLSRERKREIIEDLRSILKKAKALIFVSFKGIKGEDFLNLKRSFKKEGSDLRVIKKTLFIKALEFEKKEDLIPEVEKIKTQLALAYDKEDPVKLAKIVYKGKKELVNLEPLGGIIEGSFCQVEKIDQLSKLPSLAELRGQLVGVLSGNLTAFLRVLKGPQESFVRVIKSYQEKVSSKS